MMCNITQIANDKSIKDIRDEICKDTPVKTEINKPYIDNIDAYNRDRALITKSLSDGLNLGLSFELLFHCVIFRMTTG